MRRYVRKDFVDAVDRYTNLSRSEMEQFGKERQAEVKEALEVSDIVPLNCLVP